MPQRFLKPGITNSERWNAVQFDSQSLYIRLLTLVDDYGRCDGRTALLHGQCFSIWNALHPDKFVDLQQVDGMLQQLAAIKLIEMYHGEGKRVIQITQWTERIREGVKERFVVRDLQQLPATCGELLPSPSPSPSLSPPSILVTSGYRPTLRECELVYQWYPKKVGRGAALKAIMRALKKHDSEKIMESTKAMGEAWKMEPSKQYCPCPSKWFNEERYLDDHETYRPNSPFKPNQRNQGLATDPIEQGKKTAAFLAAKKNGGSQPELIGGTGL